MQIDLESTNQSPSIRRRGRGEAQRTKLVHDRNIDSIFDNAIRLLSSQAFEFGWVDRVLR